MLGGETTPPLSYEESFGAGTAADEDEDRILELLQLTARLLILILENMQIYQYH